MARRVPLRICLFSTASSLPVRIADLLGLLADAGLAAEFHLTRGSRESLEGLATGRYDVVHAAPDNFIEWSDRTGADIVSLDKWHQRTVVADRFARGDRSDRPGRARDSGGLSPTRGSSRS